MRRLAKILKGDGKTVIVAMDHGQSLSVNPALNNTGEILKKIVKGGADAMIVTYGIAQRYADILQDVGLIVRIDGGGSKFTKRDTYFRMMYTIEDALKIGADAVVCMGCPGTTYEHEGFEVLAQAVADGNEWGVPVVAEMLPGGFGPEPAKTIENIAFASRVGCEYGASIIKTAYSGTPEEFKAVIDASFKPVIVLGGDKTSDLSGLYECIKGAMSVGAAGVAIGRNVWGSDDPERITAQLVELVHGK